MKEEPDSAADVNLLLPRCPRFSRWKGDLKGCGSYNVYWGGDGMWDCADCGIFFTSHSALDIEAICPNHLNRSGNFRLCSSTNLVWDEGANSFECLDCGHKFDFDESDWRPIKNPAS